MKKVTPFLVLIFFVFSCEEEGPFINFEEEQDTLVDTSYVSSTAIPSVNKNVLFEEFSGVRCSNCPAGTAATLSIFNDKGARFIPVAVHSNFLALPYQGSQDLRVPEADEIASSLGPVGQKPSAFVSRRELGGARLQPALGNWSSTVDLVLAEESFVEMNLEIVATDLTERTLRYRITLSYNQSAPAQNLGFFLTESEIVASQLDGSTIKDNYVHEFVLRKAVTPIIGASLTTGVPENTVIIKEFEIDIDEYDPNQIWDMNHMHLVAFIRLENNDIETAIMEDIVE